MITKNIVIQNLSIEQMELIQMAKNATGQKTTSKAIFQVLNEFLDLKKRVYSKLDKPLIRNGEKKKEPIVKRTRKLKGIKIGDCRFKTKDHAIKYFSVILNNTAIRSKVYSLKLFSLMDLHPESKKKIGVGIDHFYVDYSPEWKNSKCFWLCRHDGTCEDFSFMKIIKEYKESKYL